MQQAMYNVLHVFILQHVLLIFQGLGTLSPYIFLNACTCGCSINQGL